MAPGRFFRYKQVVSRNDYYYVVRMSSAAPSSVTPRVFPQTRWSVVLAARQASPEAGAALETLCGAYWYPLYAFVRRCGKPAADAQDLTQEFFCRLLEKRWLDSADPAKGKLRTFLMVALKRFMANEWERASTQRRGGGKAHLPIDTAFAESRWAADPQALAPEEAFDRQWALTLISLTTHRLRAEFTAAGKPGDYDALKNCLLADRGAIEYPAVAEKLGVNEGAARVAVHRLRKRFREIYREEISQTLAEGANLQDELHHLAAALARR
jgi:RNA polymerase sigma-70 factor (ECF subfamily)